MGPICDAWLQEEASWACLRFLPFEKGMLYQDTIDNYWILTGMVLHRYDVIYKLNVMKGKIVVQTVRLREEIAGECATLRMT